LAGYELGEVLWRAGSRAYAAQSEGRISQVALDGYADLTTARQDGNGAVDKVEQQLDFILGHVARSTCPAQDVLTLADVSSRYLLRGSQVDLRPGRPGGAESETCELQPG